MSELGDALLHAYIGRLDVRWAVSPHGGTLLVVAPAVERPLSELDQCVPLDDTSRAPVVPLRPNGGDRG